jgi:5-methylcytosine-specific restriction endonuclease McrA
MQQREQLEHLLEQLNTSEYRAEKEQTLLNEMRDRLVQHVYREGQNQAHRGIQITLQDIKNDLDRLVEALRQTDWSAHLEAYDQKQTTLAAEFERHTAAFEARISPCADCGQLFKQNELQSGSLKPRSHSYWQLCLHCVEQLRAKYTRCCSLCGSNYIADRLHDKDLLCEKCYSPRLQPEVRRVVAHNERARDLGLPASLTLQQWLETLEYFGWKCAYCSSAFQSLEHYLPLSMDGGTTAQNCLPTCKSCNSRKHDLHPDAFGKLFPAENMARIRAYLVGRTENRKADELAALNVIE